MIRLITILIFYMCSLLCAAQVTINPVYDRTSLEVLHPHVDKVELTKDSTKVYCSLSYQESFSYNIPKTMFIEDTKNNMKYQITKCIGLPFEPEERVFNYGGTFQFVFCFPHIENLHKFNLIQDPSKDNFFNIYGIDISTKYPKVFEEREYIRFKNMSDFYKSSGDIDKFVEFEEQELLSAQYIFGMRSFAADACYIEFAHFYNEIGDYSKAIDFGIQALECDSLLLGVENKEYPVYVNTLGSLSLFYHNAGKEMESLHCLQKCIRIRRNIGDEKEYINELINLLITGGHSNDDILKRIDFVNQELEDLPNFIEINSLPIASIYMRIGSLYSRMNDNKNAIEYCDKALFVMESNGYNNNEDYAELLGLQCKYQQRSGLKDEAISSGTAAKQLFESLNIRSLKYAELLGDLAWAYGLALNFEKSIQLQTIAAGIYENAKDWISLAEVYNSISHYYQSAENLDDAERNIKKAIDVLNEHDNAEQYIHDEVVLTGNKMINNPFAISSINQRINTDKSLFYQTLARIYQKKGDFTNAISTELKSGAIIRSMGDDQLYAIHLMTLSEYYLRNHQLSDAIASAENSIQLLSEDNSMSPALPKLQLANICFQAGDTINAIHYAEESVFEAKSFNEKEITITALYILSYFYWKKRDYGKAEEYLSEELDYLRNFISNELTGMTTEQKQRLWSKYEHNFLLYRNIVEKSNRNDVLLSKMYDYVLFSKSLLLDVDIQDDTNRMKITWKDIQLYLSDEDIAIEFISTIEEEGGNNTYHALVLDKSNSSPRMITLYSETKLNDIKKTTTRNIQDIVGELIWKPILAQYSNVKNIYFSLDGILHILPIEYFNVSSTTNMFEQYKMYRLSSTKELVSEHSHKQFSSAVLYGGLDYNQLKEKATGTSTTEIGNVWRGVAERGGFDPLFNTLEETQEIRNLLDSKNISTTLYTGEKGTEESFRNLSNQKYNIIHLATHGMYVNPDVVETKKTEDNFAFLESLVNTNDPVKEDAILTHSFLVLSGGNRLITRDSVSDSNNDGILTSKEISLLNLKSLDLVVLSACESALGDIDNGGIYGLQRGFKKAGANTILMSLDKVDDEATKIIMVEFYKNLMSGKSKLQSLKDAQKYLRQVEDGKYDDPQYWASFILLDGIN